MLCRGSGVLSRRAFILGMAAVIAGCGSRSMGPPPAPQWQFAYWFWAGSSAEVLAPTGTVDALFFKAGTIQRQSRGGEEGWSVNGHLPNALPPAREYWAVFRSENYLAVPPAETVADLSARLDDIQADAKRRGLKLVGLQLDIDAPTRSLPAYAAYLAAVRKAIGPDMRLSITALLDWFRPGTAIADVVRAADEYVPQFYDLGNPGLESHGIAIAASIDSKKWAAVFSRYGKPFRIGVSTFGRVRLAPVKMSSGGSARSIFYRGVRPLDVAVNSAFTLETSTTEAKELVLRYRATRDARVGNTDFARGSALEFVLSTPQALETAVAEARRMGSLCAGVVFFRWPEFNESLTAQPFEVLAAVGAAPPNVKATQLQTLGDECAAVYCADLYLIEVPTLLARAVRYVIHAGTELEYFLPDEATPARLVGPAQIEFVLPPYCGRARLHLGCAVTAKKAQYSLEAIQQ